MPRHPGRWCRDGARETAAHRGPRSRLRHARGDARDSGRAVCRAPRAPARARGCARHRSGCDLRRSRAQRQPGLPLRLRSALRGGAAGHRSGTRAGHPGRQRILGGRGRRGAGDAAPSVPGVQPAEPAARPFTAAARDPGRRRHRAGQPRRRHRLEDLRRSGAERPAGLPGRRAALDRRARGIGPKRDRPVHPPGERAADHQRARPDRPVRVGELPDVAGRAQFAGRTAPRDHRARGGGAPGLEWLAALLPSHALCGATGDLRAAEPGRPTDRARRPVHHCIRDLGRAHLPRRLRRG